MNESRRKILGALVASGLLPGCGSSGGGSGKSNSADNVIAVNHPVQVDVPPLHPPVQVDVPPLNPPVQVDVPPLNPPVPVDVPPLDNPNLPSLANSSSLPLYIAHRGGAALYPEETSIAYDESVKRGHHLLEGDVHTLADGALAMFHDETVDRITTSAGSVSALDTAQFTALRIDANDWHGSNFGNQLVPMMFSDWVARYKSQALLIPEDKDQRSTMAILAVFEAQRISKNQAMVQCFSAQALKAVVAAGYPACLLVNDGKTHSTFSAADGISWVGIPFVTADADLRAWIGKGANVLLWSVNRRSIRDAKLALGAKGFFSDDLGYLLADKPLATTDQFETGTWAPGMLGSGGDVYSVSRGKFFVGGYWGYESLERKYLGCLQGYLCPIKGASQAKSFTIRMNIRFGAALADDQSRWASLFIGIDDNAFVDANDDAVGYHFLFRKNGYLEIYKKAAGTLAQLLLSRSGVAIRDGEEVSFRVTVSETTLVLSRLDATGVEKHIVKVDDQTTRGAYLHLGRHGLACAFRKLSIS